MPVQPRVGIQSVSNPCKSLLYPIQQNSNTDTWCRTIKLNLQSILPDYPTLDLFDFPSLQLYPPPPAIHSDSGTEQQLGASRPPFPTSQTFSIPLPERIPLPSWAHQDGGGDDDALLPGTLNLTAYNKGQIRYSLTVRLVLSSGQIISHSIPVEGTPQVQVQVRVHHDHEPAQGDEKDEVGQVEQVLTKKGVMTRLVLSTARPRLGDLLHLGVEIKRDENDSSSSSKGEKGTAEGEEEETKAALRRMRRVTVELFRRVIVHLPDTHAGTGTGTITHQTVLHASGKSLRYPGPSPTNPPLRLLFTIPTIPNPSSSTTTTHGGTGEQSWGEVSAVGGYHQVTFGVRVGVGGGIGVGVGVGVGSAGGGGDENDFVVEKEIEILPKIWSPLPPPDQHHPQLHQQQQQQQQQPQRATYQLQTQDGFAFDIPPELAAELSLNSSPSPYSSDAGAEAAIADTLSARDAYRLKGRDIVGPSGTTRLPPPSSSGNAREGGGGGGEDDLPPPFESSAESSAINATPTLLDGPGPGPSGAYFGGDVDEEQGSGLPSFLESEQQEERRARARAASLSDACLYALRGARGKEREASAGRSTAGSAGTRGEAAAVEGNGQGAEEEGWSDDEELGVGREGLGGELATWIEVCHILPLS